MTYLAKTIITPIIGQYMFTYPAGTAAVNHTYTPVYKNGTTTFTNYASISGDSIVLQPGDYFIECYLGASKSATNSYMTYKLVINGIDAVAPKGWGYLSYSIAATAPDGFQYDLTVDENTTKTIQIKCHSVTATVTYNTSVGTMLIWRL